MSDNGWCLSVSAGALVLRESKWVLVMREKGWFMNGAWFSALHGCGWSSNDVSSLATHP
jgi:hypothetical protein